MEKLSVEQVEELGAEINSRWHKNKELLNNVIVRLAYVAFTEPTEKAIAEALIAPVITHHENEDGVEVYTLTFRGTGVVTPPKDPNKKPRKPPSWFTRDGIKMEGPRPPLYYTAAGDLMVCGVAHNRGDEGLGMFRSFNVNKGKVLSFEVEIQE